MKRHFFLVPVLCSLIVLALPGCNSKSGSWTKQDKDKWSESCMKFMTERGVEQKQATDFCDCMLKKTSEKYTPEEARKITPDEERQLWQQCDYQW